MPKIDTTAISGFETMTDTEKLAALLDFDIPEAVDVAKLKAQFDKTSSELAEAKRNLKNRMTEEELTKAEADKAHNELQEKYEALLKESTISKYKAKYLALGYDEKLAEETAEALYSGETDKVFANGEKFRSAIEQKTKTELLKGTPKPGGTGSDSDEEKTADMLMAERIGKARAESAKAANSILTKFTGGN
jgi:ribosomal protein L16 Arg81 hydroxylase